MAITTILELKTRITTVIKVMANSSSTKTQGVNVRSLLIDLIDTLISLDTIQVPVDWESSTSPTQILNKPVLFNGDYNALTNQPTLFSGNYFDLTSKPSFATVATTGLYSDLLSKPTLFSGSYTDLTNKPTIPSAQVNSDWNSISGASQILNKPSIPTVPTYYNSSGVITSPTKMWLTTATPTTGNGYSINISSAGFTTILGYSIIVVKNNSTANSSANVSVKSVSTSAIVVNIVEGNASTTTILGINVLSGSPLDWANTTGMTLSVLVIGT